jgi:hypothetical protein
MVVPSTRRVIHAWAADGTAVEVTRRIEKTIAAFAWILMRI